MSPAAASSKEPRAGQSAAPPTSGARPRTPASGTVKLPLTRRRTRSTPQVPPAPVVRAHPPHGQTKVHQAGQIALLTVMIILGLIGFAVHAVWIVIVIAMAGMLVRAITRVRGPRNDHDGGADFITAFGDEIRDLVDGAASALSHLAHHGEDGDEDEE